MIIENENFFLNSVIKTLKHDIKSVRIRKNFVNILKLLKLFTIVKVYPLKP